MVQINTTASLESFRRFVIYSTCRSFIPDSYLGDPEVFPEREGEGGAIYVEAADKVTLKGIRDISFINATDILGVIYASKSGNTRLIWRQIRGRAGKVSGEASANSLVNLHMARVITEEYAEQIAKQIAQANQQPAQPPEPAEQVIEEAAETPVEEETSSPTSETLEQEAPPRKEGFD